MAKKLPPYETLTGLGRIPYKVMVRTTIVVVVMIVIVLGIVFIAPDSPILLYGLLTVIVLGGPLAVIMVSSGIRRSDTWMDFSSPKRIERIIRVRTDYEYPPDFVRGDKLVITHFVQVVLDDDSTRLLVEGELTEFIAGDTVTGQMYANGHRVRHLKKVAI